MSILTNNLSFNISIVGKLNLAVFMKLIKSTLNIYTNKDLSFSERYVTPKKQYLKCSIINNSVILRFK